MAKATPSDHAYGLEIGGSAVRLAKLRRTGADRFAVDAYQSVAYSAGDAGVSLAQALASLDLPSGGDRLAVCIADHAVLYRRLELPPVDAQAMDQMVRTQMEVLLPLPPQQLAWGWAVAADSGEVRQADEAEPRGSAATRRGRGGGVDEGVGVLVCAARRDAAEALAGAGMAVRPALTLASALAAAAALRWVDPQPRQSIVLLDVSVDTTMLLIAGPGGAAYGGAVAGGGDTLAPAGAADDDAIAAWRRELSHAYRQAIESLPEAVRPARCVLIGRGSRTAGLAQAAAEATGLRVVSQAPSTDRGVALPANAPFDEALPAVGAAMHLLEPPTQVISLGEGLEASLKRKRATISRRALAAAAAIILAVAGLYWMDLRHAAKLEAAVASGAADPKLRSELARAVALGDYLRNQPPPPLLALHGLSQAISERGQVTQWQYDRRGQFRVSGTVRGVGEIDQTLTRLTDAPPFSTVELRNANVQRDVWTFEIETELMPLYRYLALAPPTASSTPPEVDGDRDAERGAEREAQRGGDAPWRRGPGGRDANGSAAAQADSQEATDADQ